MVRGVAGDFFLVGDGKAQPEIVAIGRARDGQDAHVVPIPSLRELGGLGALHHVHIGDPVIPLAPRVQHSAESEQGANAPPRRRAGEALKRLVVKNQRVVLELVGRPDGVGGKETVVAPLAREASIK